MLIYTKPYKLKTLMGTSTLQRITRSYNDLIVLMTLICNALASLLQYGIHR